MRFNLTQVASAAAIAVVGVSAHAGANIDPSLYGTPNLYLTGSSAVDPTLTKFIANASTSATLDVYRSDIGTRTYFLWTASNPGTAAGGFAFAGTQLAISKNTGSSSEGLSCTLTGTGSGATSVSSCNNASFLYLQPSDLATAGFVGTTTVPSGCTESTIAATTSIPTYKLFSCGTSLVPTKASVNPDFGFSDSEPQQYSTLTTVNLTSQVQTASPISLIFGIPVSTAVRNSLQAAQGLTVGSDLEAQMPNITVAQLNSILTRKYTAWTDATGMTAANQTTGGLTDNNIYVVRRSNGSGTTRITNEELVGEFCSPGIQVSAAGTALSTTPATDCVAGSVTKIWQAGITEDLLTCIVTYNGGGAGAIGIASTDFVSGQNGSPNGYRFIKVNGSAPTIKNVGDGKYGLWSELVINYSKARLGAAADPTAATDQNGFWTRFKTASADPVFLGEVSANLTNTGGWQGGIMGSAIGGNKQPAGWGLPASNASFSVLTDRATAYTITAGGQVNYVANPFTRQQNNLVTTNARWNLCNRPNPQAAGYSAKD
jgi:ABC-type phosphate transport system substrate-binding protein